MGARWSVHFDSLRSTLIDLVSVALLAFPKPSLERSQTRYEKYLSKTRGTKKLTVGWGTFDFQNRLQQFLANSCNFCLHSNNESNISIEAKLKWHRVSQTSSPSLRVNISKVQGRFYLER